jgi:predicted metalloprotease with PDZ domain
MIRRSFNLAALVTAFASQAPAQEPVRYTVRVDDPSPRLYHVQVEAPAQGDTTYLSLPAWTPGHYKIENYARYVHNFKASDGQRPLRWDKLDKDTWRIESRGAATVRASFDYPADTVGLSFSLLRDDFGYFNGTNLFLYPETGVGYDFPAEVKLELPEGWKVATELEETADPFVFRATDYHQLVDNPTFIGHYAIDSVQVNGVWTRLAVYPAPYLRNPAREMALDALRRIAATIHGMFGGEPPYDRYTTFVYLDDGGFMFLAGLEHAESQLDVMPAMIFEQPRFSFRPYLFALLAHEYFHAWNVKRLRPAGLWPYEYDREQPTPLLWVAEGITDYYANVVLVRSELWTPDLFWLRIRETIQSVETEPAHVAVEDASLEAWIEPTFIDPYIYYDKGGLLGLLLDIKIRHATGNASSLDDVMTRLYRERYSKGSGFTTADFLAFVGEYVGADAAREFYERYVDGRQPLPYRETLALAGMQFDQDTIVEPFFGADAGVLPGDELLAVGTIDVLNERWGLDFVREYAGSEGATLEVLIRRAGKDVVGETTVRTRTRYDFRLQPVGQPSEDQHAIRKGIESGSR